ncbi:MAG: SDR family oxidoreductase [Bdellovibrionales bacterium]|nr:SDR family oxidoreductase [Bdellovibrionales bacterium]
MNTTKQKSSRQRHKTVIITGGGSGIGLDTARKLLEQEDYRVVLVGKNRERLQEAVETLDASPDRLSIAECDLADAASIQATINKLVATHPSIWGLVNNAGIYPFGGLGTTTSESWDETFMVNLKAPFLMIQGIAPYLAKNPDGGRIVNVSSTAGILPNHFALAYSVSKAALITLTRTLAKELGKENITVNCVCPGIVKSPLHEAYHTSRTDLESFYAKRGAAFPLGRVGEPQDISGIIRYFLSEEASWVTGDIFIADGGRLLL